LARGVKEEEEEEQHAVFFVAWDRPRSLLTGSCVTLHTSVTLKHKHLLNPASVISYEIEIVAFYIMV
jgi:hypothetical protein